MAAIPGGTIELRDDRICNHLSTRNAMQKQLKVPALKIRLRAAMWIVVVTSAAWHCPDAHAQAGKAPATPPTVEAFFNRYSQLPRKVSLLVLAHPRKAAKRPVLLAARRHYSPVLAKAAKNNPDSLIRAALLQDRIDLPGTTGNPGPSAGRDVDKSRTQNEPPTLEGYIRSRGLKKKP